MLTLYLARQLGPEGFGIFSLALGLTGLLLKPAALGTTQAAARYVAERQGDNPAVAGILSMALPIRLTTAAAIAVALFALAGPISNAYGEPDLAWPLRGMAIAFFGQSMLLFSRSIFMALRRTSATFILVVSESAVECTATIVLVALGGGVTGAAFGRAAGYAFGAVLGLILLARLLGMAPLRRGRDSPVTRRDFVSYSGTMLIVQGASSIFGQIDVILLGAFLSASAVGLFTAPLRMMTLVSYPATALSQAVAPRMARHTHDSPRIAAMQLALRYVIILQLAVVTAVAVWADPIVRLTLGEEFAESANILRALSFYVFLSGLNPLLVAPLNYAGEGRRRIPNAIAAVVLNAALDIALIPAIGVYGAVIGTGVAYTFYVGYHLWLCHRLLDLALSPLVRTAARSLLGAAALAGVLVLVGTDELSIGDWFVGVIGGATAYIGVLLATRETTVAGAALGDRRTVAGAAARLSEPRRALDLHACACWSQE